MWSCEWVTNPERPAQLDRDLISRPIFALIIKDLQNTENAAIVMYIALFVFWHLDQDSWLEDWWFRIQEEDGQSLTNDQAIGPSNQSIKKNV